MTRQLPNHTERLGLINRVVGVAEAATEDTTHNRAVAWHPTYGIVHTFVGGSDLHGAAVGTGNDLDIFGLFIEHPSYGLGIDSRGEPSWETFQWSTAPDTRKNTESDVDVTLHSLRKWARLAATGNPTILNFLFVKCEHEGVWKDFIYPNRHLFLARSHVNAFLGYADQQYLRINGMRSLNTNRPELIKAFGYDTKMAMHLIRLTYECLEFLTTGNITFPSPMKDELIGIRLGRYTKEQVNEMYADLKEKCNSTAENSSLPEHVDRRKISEVVCEAYRTHWQVYDWYEQKMRWV